MNFTGEVQSVLLGATLLGSGSVELLGFFEAEALGVDVDDLGAVDETIDEGDDAGGVREDLAPGGEGLVGAEEKRLLGLVSPGDRGWQASSGASAVDDLPNGAYVNGVARERLAERLLELGGPGGVEDLEEPGGRAADVVATLGDEPEQRLTAASGPREAVETAMLAARLFSSTNRWR